LPLKPEGESAATESEAAVIVGFALTETENVLLYFVFCSQVK
jgi:hypothetical protein